MAIYESTTAALSPAFNMDLSDKAESDAVRFAHGELIMAIHEKGMKRLILEYPDLDPDLNLPESLTTPSS
jgi:hypothetical protein